MYLEKCCIIVTESVAVLLPKTLHAKLPKMLHSYLPFTIVSNKREIPYLFVGFTPNTWKL